MISHKHQLIHVHLPKNGGTSIQKALGHFDGSLALDIQDHRNLRMIEHPLFTPYEFSSTKNVYNLLRRVHNRYRKRINPFNALTVTQEHYDEASRDLIASFYKHEIALFGYTFESY